ncbi:MAG: hypothetical protein ACUZ8I_11875 [Candidatus Scalindua sp.]
MVKEILLIGHTWMNNHRLLMKRILRRLSRASKWFDSLICKSIINGFQLTRTLMKKVRITDRQKELVLESSLLNAHRYISHKDHLDILLVNGKWDCAGVSISLCNAINKYTPHQARHIVKEESTLQYETDITAKDYNAINMLSLLKIIEEADIIHFNYADHTVPFFDIKWSDFINNKKLIYHDHSGWEPLKDLHDEYKAGRLFHKYDNYDQVIVCAPSDTHIFHKATWLPNLMPIYREDYRPTHNKSYNGTIIIGQTAVSQKIKSTDLLVTTVKEIQARGYDVALDIVTGVSHSQALRRKREHQIEFDNMYQGHHGMAGLEAISMGIPTLAWLKPKVVEAYEEIGEGSDVPFINVRDKNELMTALIKMIENRDLLKEKSIYCQKWIEKYYNEKYLVNMYIDLYERIMAGKDQRSSND